MSRSSAQLILSWDGLRLLAEAPGPSGTRVKLDAGPFSSLPLALREALDASLTRLRDQEAAKLREVQARNIQHVAESPGMGLAFAKQIWSPEALAAAEAEGRFQRSLAAKRLHPPQPQQAPQQARHRAKVGELADLI